MAGDRNDAAYDELVNALERGAVAFIGAGSSMRVGYPSWPGLLDELAAMAAKAAPADSDRLVSLRTVDMLLRAQEYKTVIGPAPFVSHLCSTFGPRVPQYDEFHTPLVSIPFHHVLTTNYDPVLEAAHEGVHGSSAARFDMDEWDKSSEFFTSLAADDYGRRYVHVHGSVGRPEGMILTKEDYDRHYLHDTRWSGFLKTLFTVKRVVFIGCSLSDEDFMYVLRALCGSLQLNQPRHFAICPRPDSDAAALRLELNRKYHIEPYFYDPADHHAALLPLIISILKDVQAAVGARKAITAAGSRPVIPVPSVGPVMQPVAEDPAAKGTAAQRPPDVVAGRPAALSLHAAATTDDVKGEIDLEIEAVFKYIDQGLPDVAIEQYKALERRHEVALTNRLRYRILANSGHALYSKGDERGAANAYLEAVALYKASKDARALEILAYFILEETEKAQRLAAELCADEPLFARAQWLRIRTLPAPVAFSEAEASVPEPVRGDAEVASALSDMAARLGDVAMQEKYARAALASSPQWPDALGAAATAILRAEHEAGTHDVGRGIVPRDPRRVEEADRYLTQAIQFIPQSDPKGRLAGAYFNRSVARRMLGRIAEADADVAEACRHDPSDPQVVLGLSLKAKTPDEVDAAVRAIERVWPTHTDDPKISFTLALLLDHRSAPGDRDRAIAILREQVPRLDRLEPEGYAPDIARLLTTLLLGQDRVADARALLAEIPPSALHPSTAELLAGRLEQHVGDNASAIRHAERAIRLIDGRSTWLERREVALFGGDMRLWEGAFEVWRGLVAPIDDNADTLHLLRAAHFAGQGSFILEYCDELRRRGVARKEYLELEVDTLTRSNEYDRAIAMIRDWLSSHPDDRDLRLALALIGMHEGRDELIEKDAAKLPHVDEVPSAARGAQCAFVLRRGPDPEAGLRYAYQLWRRFPDHAVAHEALVRSVIDPTAPAVTLDAPQAVDLESAVRIAREGEPGRWIVIEDGPKASTTRDEFAPTHELARSLLGRAVGDTFRFQSHLYRIEAIQHKIVQRVNRIMEFYEETFPDRPAIRRFHLPQPVPRGASPQEILGEVWTELQRAEQHRRELESLYRREAFPIAIIAQNLGKSVFETVLYFASAPGLGVRAASGNATEWDRALRSLNRGVELVLDTTALATVYVLGLHKEGLANLGFKLAVPKSAVDEVRRMSLEAGSRRGPRAYLAVHEGRPLYREITAEETAAEVEALEGLLGFIREHCEVVGGAATLDLEPDMRDTLRAVGEGSADAMAIARRRGAILWTDDFVVGAGAATPEFGVTVVWTQAVLFRAAGTNAIAADEYTKAVGQLLIGGYAFTRVSATDIAALLRSAEWNTRGPLGTALAGVMGRFGLQSRQNQIITAAGIMLIWDQCRSVPVAKRVIIELLEAMAAKAVRRVLVPAVCRGLRVLDRRYPRNKQLRQFLRSWLSRDGEFKPRPHGRRRHDK